MPKFRKQPVVIDAVTFDEFVELGKKQRGPAELINGMPWAFTYGGHAITHENDDCYLIPTLEGTMRFERGDMLITGVKGEIYPCKPDIFAMTYEPASEASNPVGDFGFALFALKQGKRVARAGWNGKGMWLALSCNGTREVPAANFWAPPNRAYAEMQPGGTAMVLPSITMKTATGEILMGWLASQTDMLAEDWTTVE